MVLHFPIYVNKAVYCKSHNPGVLHEKKKKGEKSLAAALLVHSAATCLITIVACGFTDALREDMCIDVPPLGAYQSAVHMP